MSKNYYEFKDKTSSKFWEITVKGSMVTVGAMERLVPMGRLRLRSSEVPLQPQRMPTK